MNIRDLSARTGATERHVRYLIAGGFMPSPRGGRANADYGEDHVAAVLRYARLRDLGFPPAAIKLLLEAHASAPFPVAPGITLVVDPGLLGSGEPAAPLVARVHAILSDILEESRHAESARGKHD